MTQFTSLESLNVNKMGNEIYQTGKKKRREQNGKLVVLIILNTLLYLKRTDYCIKKTRSNRSYVV